MLSLYDVVGVILIEVGFGGLFSIVTEDCVDAPLWIPSLGVTMTVHNSPLLVSIDGITLLVCVVVSPFCSHSY